MGRRILAHKPAEHSSPHVHCDQRGWRLHVLAQEDGCASRGCFLLHASLRNSTRAVAPVGRRALLHTLQGDVLPRAHDATSAGNRGVKGLSARRSRLRIIAEILKVVEREGEANVSKILLEANLSYARLAKYLDELVGKGFLQRVTDEREVKFRLTRKGQEFLREFRRIEQLAEAFGIEL
uniref:ArnR1-like winged helix-turn-helix domain-containing protein n=1 Tax=Thermofilum pendens TaxID=2269 RepID=A0A7C4B9R9_THEPE